MNNQFPPHNTELTHGPPLSGKGEEGALAPLACEPQDYMNELAEFEMSDEQKTELLQTLWNIMATMVDIGWGVDTVQLFLPEIFDKAATDFDGDSEKLLDSKDTEKKEVKGGNNHD